MVYFRFVVLPPPIYLCLTPNLLNVIIHFSSVYVLPLQEWDMLSFIKSLKGMIRCSNAVAIITFPPSLLSPSSSKRWQHLADTLLSVGAIRGLFSSFCFTTVSMTLFLFSNSELMHLLDEDKELATLLAGYQDMVGLLNIHKVARINTQVSSEL